MRTFRVIATRAVSELTEVRLYDETIEKVRKGHPEIPAELPFVVSSVVSAIEDPEWIERSYGETFVFVDPDTSNASGDPLRVPVKRIKGTTSGRVKSFYFASTEGQPDVIWRKSHGKL